MKINDWIYTFETEFEMFKGFKLPVRSTVLRFSNGEDMLISPIAFTEADWAEIKSKLNVKHIVAPCNFHHLFVKSAKRNLGEAKLWATHDLAQKRKDITWDGQGLPKNWTMSEEVEAIPVLGGATHEVLFYHKKAKALVVTDFLFNLHNRSGFLSWFFLHLFGTWNRPAMSRMFKATLKSKTEFKITAEKILSLDIDMIVMAHGNIITENAKGVLTNALRERNLI